MRQRNTHGYPLMLMTLDPPRTVHHGEEVDHPERLAGFTPVAELDDQDDTTEPDTSDQDPRDPDTPMHLGDMTQNEEA